MNKENYLKIVINQIRCEKAKGMISEEIENHIDDQAKVYIDMGMGEAEAMAKAVKEMGDPVDTGVSLDRIHRPKMAWNVLWLIGIISIISIFVQFIIDKHNLTSITHYRLYYQLIFVILGLVIMLVTYLIDYSVIGKYGKEIGAVFCLFIFLQIFFFGVSVNGSTAYISFYRLHISTSMLMYLYAPVYGAILYQYRGYGYQGFIKSIIWLMIPVFLALRMPNFSLACSLFLILLLTVTIAIVKDWFKINKKITLCLLWGAVTAIPIIGITIVLKGYNMLLATYQIVRLKSFLNPNSSEMGYQIARIRQLINASKIIGMNDSGMQTYDTLPDINSDYILTHVISYYGILAAFLLVAMMGLLISRIFKISSMQKNQLGMIMGCACGLAYCIQVITYILQNIGLWPFGSLILPLFSYGATGTIVSYMLLGILLSIYRYQSIIQTKAPKRKKIKVIFIED